LLGPQDYSNEKLFQMYYTSGESVGISRSGNTNVVEALLQYQKGNYQEACLLFTELLREDPGNAAISYYCGISNIETGDYDDAIRLFEEILKNGNTLYIEYAQWYLGLSYLVKERNEEAVELFKTIAAEEGHYYQEDAKSLLDKIENSIMNKNIINKILFFVLPF
jgi:tetratricopeptide (TPR) repeat protein